MCGAAQNSFACMALADRSSSCKTGLGTDHHQFNTIATTTDAPYAACALSLPPYLDIPELKQHELKIDVGSEYGGITPSEPNRDGAQDAPISGEKILHDTTARRGGADAGAMEDAHEVGRRPSEEREERGSAEAVAEVAPAGSGNEGAEAGPDGQERVDGGVVEMREGEKEELTSIGDREGKSENAQEGVDETQLGVQEEDASATPIVQDATTTTTTPAVEAPQQSQEQADMAMPMPALPDAVHIVDDNEGVNPLTQEQDDLQVAALQAAANDLNLNIKTELANQELPMPMPTLAPPFELDNTMSMPPLDALPYTSDGLLEQYAAEEPAAAPVQPATGFAKLEFQDGHFYMTTYAVELGRDMRAYRVAQQYQARLHHKSEFTGAGAKQQRGRRSASVPGTPVRPIKNDNAGMSARSFLSESGGIVGEDDGHIKLRKKKKRKSSRDGGAGGKMGSKSTDTSSRSDHSNSLSRKNSIISTPHPPSAKFDYNAAALLTSQQPTVDPNATAPLDPMVHMPDPHFTPLIPVHPPMNSDEEFQTGKGISRKHIRISYNFDRCHFEMSVYGRNGAFHDEQHHASGATVPLHDGSVIQIGGVSLRFVLPTVALESGHVGGDGETDFDSVSGRMSFGFEDAHGESVVLDEEEMEEFASPEERARRHAEDYEDYGYDDELLDEDEEGDESEDDADDSEEEEESSEEEPIKKKRGPGRPRIHERKIPPASAKAKAAAAANKKTPTKITLKISAKDKARERERARLRAEAEERERKRAEAKAKAAKLKAKEAAKAAKAKEKEAAEAEAQAEAAREKAAAKKAREAEAARARKEKERDAETVAKANADPSMALVKEESKEPSKTPALDSVPPPSASIPPSGSVDPSSSKEPSAPRIARDAPMQNGEDINVPGLPAGIIIPARKKGPGRPPKDGVMSKRERAQLIKQAKEREKAIKAGMDPNLLPPPLPEPPRKPKIPRRNSQGELLPSDPDDPSSTSNKIARPAKSPSPEMRIEDFTEEQLQRPTANYVYLIYEAIKASKGGVMNLQQIYSAIERRYPWYRFRAGSHGWQSSVRHNLGQHEVSIVSHPSSRSLGSCGVLM